MGSRLDNPFPDSYDVDLSDVEADSSGETEAGTKQRDLVRLVIILVIIVRNRRK